ncbi:spore germination protein GerPE [Brevibacillus fluminis]|uniref:Spore germination protein GerPE n=1 Tax=Brevibacillus fluminis TaxID=511487 RepID=A0A3M8DSM3_9BACL|nr:spore germination protein GerPE [Brevibacillus fluminis]RNB91166.1 spore germination protein GerPE [Brevibacillus fluminis]
MPFRTSKVQRIDILQTGDSTVFQIGDSEEHNLHADVLAVQREEVTFFESDYTLDRFATFCADITQPVVDEPLEIITLNESPFIRVEFVNIQSVVTSSVVQIGSTVSTYAESRVKTIRHLAR